MFYLDNKTIVFVYAPIINSTTRVRNLISFLFTITNNRVFSKRNTFTQLCKFRQNQTIKLTLSIKKRIINKAIFIISKNNCSLSYTKKEFLDKFVRNHIIII